eukprot:TRINITY_DN1906_c0_g1_i1.p4 TRINITY_DN1906_c0_g1~~TRINITY_DN1906_c0_g1_i1.p4  ORF type:complete len:111 (-),score=26.67 TRINITY_DN1906_c0_g1_i1:735-1067(-)
MSYNTTLASPAFLPLLFLFEGELFFGHSHLLTSEVWKGKQWYQRRVRESMFPKKTNLSCLFAHSHTSSFIPIVCLVLHKERLLDIKVQNPPHIPGVPYTKFFELHVQQAN